MYDNEPLLLKVASLLACTACKHMDVVHNIALHQQRLLVEYALV